MVPPPLPPQKLEDLVSTSLRGTVPGPGGDFEAITHTSNQLSNCNANLDDDFGGKMFPPGAGHSISNSSSCNKRAREHSDSSDCGPPPKRTHHYEGGGHAVKRVSTDTLHPPTSKRRVTGNEVHEVT